MNFGKFTFGGRYICPKHESVRLGSRSSHLLRARKEKAREILRYYRALYGAWGPQHWWPAKTRFEVIVGAYLTQNTAWTNVELALTNIRAAQGLSIKAIRDVPLAKLEQLIRPSG